LRPERTISELEIEEKKRRIKAKSENARDQAISERK